MSEQSESTATHSRPATAPTNSAFVALEWITGIFLVAGIMMIAGGNAMNTPNQFAPMEVITAGVPLMVWGGSALGVGVMAIFSLLIVSAVRWQAPTPASEIRVP